MDTLQLPASPEFFRDAPLEEVVAFFRELADRPLGDLETWLADWSRLESLFEVSWGVDWKPVMRPRFKARYNNDAVTLPVLTGPPWCGGAGTEADMKRHGGNPLTSTASNPGDLTLAC